MMKRTPDQRAMTDDDHPAVPYINIIDEKHSKFISYPINCSDFLLTEKKLNSMSKLEFNKRPYLCK